MTFLLILHVETGHLHVETGHLSLFQLGGFRRCERQLRCFVMSDVMAELIFFYPHALDYFQLSQAGFYKFYLSAFLVKFKRPRFPRSY